MPRSGPWTSKDSLIRTACGALAQAHELGTMSIAVASNHHVMAWQHCFLSSSLAIHGEPVVAPKLRGILIDLPRVESSCHNNTQLLAYSLPWCDQEDMCTRDFWVDGCSRNSVLAPGQTPLPLLCQPHFGARLWPESTWNSSSAFSGTALS